MTTLPITVLLAAKNEALNLPKCLAAVVGRVERVVVVDSHSTDGTPELALSFGAEVVQFTHRGGYPKKRQWALDTLNITTEWVFLLDADEVVPHTLWDEISTALDGANAPNGFLITKGFHFLGSRFRFGGFSFAAVLLIRAGRARFERLLPMIGKEIAGVRTQCLYAKDTSYHLLCGLTPELSRPAAGRRTRASVAQARGRRHDAGSA